MEDQNIREWVSEKLDEGQSRELVKKALEKQGFDPSIVDEIAQSRQTPEMKEESSGFEIPDLEFRKHAKPVLTFLIVLGLVFGGYTAYDSGMADFSNPVKDSKPAETETSQDSSRPVEVVLKDGVANPARPEISAETDVRFVNGDNYSMRLIFERNVETFTLEPEDSKTVDINDLVYYTAEPVNADTGSIEGSIDVQ